MLIDRAERAASWSHGKPVGVAPLPGSERRLRPRLEDLDHAAAAQRAELSSARRRLAGRGPQGTLGHPARRGDRPGEIPVEPRQLRPHSRRAGLPDAALPHRADGRGSARPDLISRRGHTALVRGGGPDVRRRADRRGAANPRRRRLPGRAGRGPRRRPGRPAPQSALANVARAWSERTKARGPKRQLWHYRRSLNLRTPSSRPPSEEGPRARG